MGTNYAAVRTYLEKAQEALGGRDPTSRKMLEAMDLLIEAVIAAEYSAPRGEVVPFRPRQQQQR